MKSIDKNIIKEIVAFIEKSDFYNKIQIITKDGGEKTETIYFLGEEGIGHSIFVTKEDGQIEKVQDTHIIDKDFVYQRFESIEECAVFNICGNSGDNILSMKI